MGPSHPHKSGDTIVQLLKLAANQCESGQMVAAEKACQQVLALDKKNPNALHILGIIAAQGGRFEEAVGFFEQSIKANKAIPIVYFHLGLALQKQDKLDESLNAYRQALAIKPDYIEAYSAMGALFMNCGRLDEAAAQYEKIIEIKQDYVQAYNALGAIRKKQGRRDDALALYMAAVVLKPDYPEARFNLANTLKDEGLIDDSIEQYRRAIALRPDFYDAYVNFGNLLKDLKRPEEAIESYSRALEIRPGSSGVLGNLVHELQHTCAWEGLAEKEKQLLEMVRQGREGIPPFSIMALEATPADQLMGARTFGQGKIQESIGAPFRHISHKQDRIRIGYLSGDFYTHATAFLMIELFEKHDRSCFEITGYAYGRNDHSEMRARLERAFEHFVDLGSLSDRAAAQKIYDDRIDILIDLKGGYTTDSRIGISIYRPAPVQVNYIGFPGTMGVDFIDYIITDPFITPMSHQPFFSEKIVQLPDCYQPNDTKRKISDAPPTRAECGLPENGFVFCSFNNTYKITPRVFDIWMQLLKAMPGSVLWLLETNRSVKENLRREAEKRGMDPDRLIFAPRKQLPEHLARHKLADLFLDTLPVNAHTTTSDALWAGLPVLTCAGETFASRVAGSLLTAANLPELVTYSLEEYEALALKLAQNPAQLAAIREKLARTRLEVPLFDIDTFVKNLESAYQTMSDILQAGEAPRAFAVPRKS